MYIHVPQRLEQQLQHTATHCNTLQHTAIHCNTLQRTHTAVSRAAAAERHYATHHAAIPCATSRA